MNIDIWRGDRVITPRGWIGRVTHLRSQVERDRDDIPMADVTFDDGPSVPEWLIGRTRDFRVASLHRLAY